MTSPSTDRRYGVSPGLAIKAPCLVATTAAITLSGEQTIDGVAVVAGDRVLVKSQTDTTTNGIYVCDTGAWSRDIDFNGNRDAVNGTIVIVQSGTANTRTSWMLQTTDPFIIGTSALVFSVIVAPAIISSDSAAISFLAAGSGAQTRTVQAKLRDIVNIWDFIPVGTDTATTNCSPYFVYAFAAATGKALYVPGGTYRLGADTAMPSSILMYGDGDATILTTNTGGAGLGQLYADTKVDIIIRDMSFHTDGTYSFLPTFKLCDNVRIENCSFYGEKSGNTRSTQPIRTQGTTRFKLQNCSFFDFDEGVYFDSWPAGAPGTYSDFCEVRDCYFEQTGTTGGANPTAIYGYFVKNLLVDGCFFKNIVGITASDSYALYVSDGTSENVVMTNCTSILSAAAVSGANHTMCIYAGNGDSGIFSNNVLKSVTNANVSTYLYRGGSWKSELVEGNYSYGGAISMRGSSTALTAPRHMRILNNYIAEVAANLPGINIGFSQASLGYIKHAIVKGNHICGTAAGSIYVANCQDALIESNTCMNWNTNNYGTATVYQITGAIYVDNQIQANYLVVGQEYQITYAGATTWTGLGSASNAVGTIFTATAADSGAHTYGWAINRAHRAVIRDNNIGNDSSMGTIGYPKYGVAVEYGIQDVEVLGTQMNVACTVSNYLNCRERYAKGSWTPAVGGSATYGAQTGVWERNDDVVTVYFDLNITLIGTGSTGVITGLPAELTTGYACGFSGGIFLTGGQSVVELGGYISGTSIVLKGMTAAATAYSSLTVLGNGTELSGSVTYLMATSNRS